MDEWDFTPPAARELPAGPPAEPRAALSKPAPRATGHAPIPAPAVPAIDGRTRLYGLLGWPVEHTRSPQMQNAAFAALGLNCVYVPLPVPPERLPEAVAGLVALGFAGANVTLPHKAAVLPLLDYLTPAAAAVGAANTIIVRPDGLLLGDTTDGPGFLADLARHGVNPAGRRVLLLGAGGAARSLAYALAEIGAHLAVANRSIGRAETLAAGISAALPGADVTGHPFPQALPALAADAELIVNATSLGLHPADALPWDATLPFRPGQVVYDIVYLGPGQTTPLLRHARQQGATAIDGLGMLVQQGARSFELWTGHKAPVEIMAAALPA